MSEKKNKKERELKYPKYDLKSQLEYLTSFCENYHFNGDVLISLIIGQWIASMVAGQIKGSSETEMFLAFLASTEKDFEVLKEWKKKCLKK